MVTVVRTLVTISAEGQPELVSLATRMPMPAPRGRVESDEGEEHLSLEVRNEEGQPIGTGLVVDSGVGEIEFPGVRGGPAMGYATVPQGAVIRLVDIEVPDDERIARVALRARTMSAHDPSVGPRPGPWIDVVVVDVEGPDDDG